MLSFVALIVGSRPSEIDDLTSRLASAVWQVLLAGGGSILGRALSGGSARRWTTVAGGCVVMFLAGRGILGA